jgi:hypothetical protein
VKSLAALAQKEATFINVLPQKVSQNKKKSSYAQDVL